MLPRPSPIPAWRGPLVASGFLFLSQGFALPSPVNDAVTGQWASGYSLHLPLAHVLLTPFTSIADFVTILGINELLALFAFVLAGSLLLLSRWRFLIIVMGFLLLLVTAALVPRPMAFLKTNDPDVFLLDFHSHTCGSHDGRKGFDAAANKAWHLKQGFNASFITDHNISAEAIKGKADTRLSWQNDGYRSLQGEEISLWKTHLVVLGNPSQINNGPYDSDPAKVFLFIRDMRKASLPVVASLPEYWKHHWNGGVEQMIEAGISGFEIISSAPKALDFPIQDRRKILALCQTYHLFAIGISDTHGYGYATATWNAMKLPGGHSLAPDAFEAAVVASLTKGGLEAVQVLERAKFHPSSYAALAISPIANAIVYWRSLQPLQVLAWVAWLWLVSWVWPRRGMHR